MTKNVLVANKEILRDLNDCFFVLRRVVSEVSIRSRYLKPGINKLLSLKITVYYYKKLKTILLKLRVSLQIRLRKTPAFNCPMYKLSLELKANLKYPKLKTE